MPRLLMLALLLSLSANASADCDLRFAPPEVRAAALAFHQRSSEAHPVATGNASHRAPGEPQVAPHPAMRKITGTPSR